MRLVLNRKVCNCWEAACEADFADKFLGHEILPTACVVEMIDDGSKELTFMIEDRDGTDKVFVVDEINLADAIDSWMLAYTAQQEEKAAVSSKHPDESL